MNINNKKIKATLVGQKARHHVINNLEVVKTSPLTPEEWYENRKILKEMFQ